MTEYVKVTRDVTRAASYLAEGRLVAFPTGTSYGLAADALQGWALQRLRNVKERPEEKTFTVCMKDELFEEHLELNDEEQAFLKRCQNEPVTLLVRPRGSLAHLAQDGRVGLRVIDHPLMKKLAQAVDVPVTATSANKSSQEACLSPACILESFPSTSQNGTAYELSLAAILDGGELPQQEPSTILKIDNDTTHVIREGAFMP